MLLKLKLLLVGFCICVLTASAVPAADAPQDSDQLVKDFPSLDELENHMRSVASSRDGSASPPPARSDSRESEAYVFPVSARWFTAEPRDLNTPSVSSPGEKPLASLVASLNTEQKTAGALTAEINREKNLPINKYLLDRWVANAETDYGTDITGLFVNGIGFGTFQQSLRQSYGIEYKLPLLQRYASSAKWTRILNGWTFSSTAGVMPQLTGAPVLQQLLNNLQFTWSVALRYEIAGATLRKLQDGQYEKEASLTQATDRAAASRDELLQAMALRIDALSRKTPTRDTHLNSLRELYPQFEFYQARYEEAASCDERMEDFFTLKGLALSLLTLAGYDAAGNTQTSLLQTWKHAHFAGCGKT